MSVGFDKVKEISDTNDSVDLGSKTYRIHRKTEVKGVQRTHIDLKPVDNASKSPRKSKGFNDSFSKTVKTPAAALTQKARKSQKIYDFEKEVSLIKIVKRTNDSFVHKPKKLDYSGVESKLKSYITKSDKKKTALLSGIYNNEHLHQIKSLSSEDLRRSLLGYVSYKFRRVNGNVILDITTNERYNEKLEVQEAADQGTQAVGPNDIGTNLQLFELIDNYIINELQTKQMGVFKYVEPTEEDGPTQTIELYSIEDFYKSNKNQIFGEQKEGSYVTHFNYDNLISFLHR